jgi:hypothetical protein
MQPWIDDRSEPSIGAAAARAAGTAQYNLLLIYNTRLTARWDFELVAARVREIAPEIRTILWQDRSDDWQRFPPTPVLPTMTFSPGPVFGHRPTQGVVFEGRALPKSEEYAALECAGVRVPRWALLTPEAVPDLAAFDRYVVVKPDLSGRGADVKIKRKGRVRWSPPSTNLTRTVAGPTCHWIVQEFIYTGPHPTSYRVTSLFGEPIWSWKVQADTRRRPLRHRFDFGGAPDGGGMSIVSSGKGCVFSIERDPEVWELARATHRAFPDIPLIGVDIVRDSDTGQLFVIEANTIGWTWHLSSPIGRAIQQQFGFDLDTSFQVRHRTASILAGQVRMRAR